ncbi:MAG: WbuC family cupin fold metalloprotein [Planctomycetaceae bacterium]|nr:WbuC family cupin fold metalloprotein [Planctomycetaceae bacterium]
MREQDEAFFNTQRVLPVDQALIERIKVRALASPRGQFRLCLHQSIQDAVQEMIIAQRQGVFYPPHCHDDTSVSVQVLQGRLTVIIFDDNGSVIERHDLQPHGQGGEFCLRLSKGCWHMNLPRSPMTVFYETLAGPFLRETANRFPAWAPASGDPQAVRDYLSSLGL